MEVRPKTYEKEAHAKAKIETKVNLQNATTTNEP